MAETKKKKKTPADTIETKKKAALMADIRIIILKTNIHPTPIITPKPVFPVASPTPIFTFFTERKQILPKLPIYN